MTTDGSGPWTVLRLLNWTTDYFARAGLDDARLAAEVLLAHVLGCRRIELYARHDLQPAEGQRAAYRDLVRRAADAEPVAYLVGSKEFYSLSFKVTHDVLIPRPETEILVDEAVAHLRALGRGGAVWDVCTGSGCVAIAVARQAPDARVLATDICPAAVAVAQENAASHGVADRVRLQAADLLAGGAHAETGSFDVICANPPYVADGDAVADSVRHEPPLALAAGADGLDCIRPILRDAPKFLRPGGALILEFGCGQADAVRDLAVAGGGFAEPRVVRDRQNIERVCVALRGS